MKDMEEKVSKKGMKSKLIRLATLPILILGIVLIFVAYFRFYQVISNQISKELEEVAMATLYSNEELYSSSHTFSKDDNGIYTMDDELVKDKDYCDFIDYMKQETGLDITLFYYDIRVATTILDSNGGRAVGTVAPKTVVDTVINGKSDLFVDGVDILGEKYFAYYHPVLDESGECVGMVFTGKPNSEMKKTIMFNTWPIIVIALILMLIVGIGAARTATEYADAIGKIKAFLTNTAKGDFKASIDAKVIGRKDELGEMGLLAVRVQKYMRDMVEKDALTKLYCRRIGEVKFKATQENYISNGVPYCVVMGDIDHFKMFNDKYGHDCGDLVLQSVASVFNKLVFGHGYAVRWGGEEFVLIFDNCSLDKGIKLLETIKEAVLETAVIYNEERLNITMTYGILEGDGRPENEIMKDVDELLYEGKENGRNQIVVSKQDS